MNNKFGKVIVQRDRTGNSSANKCLVTNELPQKGTHRCRMSIEPAELNDDEYNLKNAKYGWVSDDGIKELKKNKGLRIIYVESIEDFPTHMIKYEIGREHIEELEQSPYEGFKKIQRLIARKQRSERRTQH